MKSSFVKKESLSTDTETEIDPLLTRLSEKFKIEFKVVYSPNKQICRFSKNGEICYVNTRYPAEKLGYGICHKLAHKHLKSRCVSSDTEEEQEALRFTSELMMPEKEIKSILRKSLSLFQIKKIFPYCSYEDIANRLLHFKKMALTMWSNYNISYRKIPKGMVLSKQPSSFEIECMHYAYKTQSSNIRRHENKGILCTAYFISKEYSRNKKVLMFTEKFK